MKMKSFSAMAGATALALTMWVSPVRAQGQPLYDRIHVNIPYKVTLGDKVLEPGEYTIQQLPDAGGDSRVLLFYSEDGMKFQTSAMTIPVLDIDTARDTKLILGHIGDDYYINKIWVQGKDYGYELAIPASLKARQSEQTVAAVPAPSQPAQPAQTAPQTESAPLPPPPPETSQAKTQPTPQPTQPIEPPQAAPPVEAPQPLVQPPNSANRMADETPAPAEMPHTAANWMMMLLSGGALSGAGMLLRRRR